MNVSIFDLLNRLITYKISEKWKEKEKKAKLRSQNRAVAISYPTEQV